MIKWKKQPSNLKIEKPKLGDVKIKRTFLWWPFLNEDGEHYWLGYVNMKYTYSRIYVCTFPMAPTYYLGWVKTKIEV